MNTKIYKAVHSLAQQLMHATNRHDKKQFESLYAELEAICVDNEHSDKDHPVQWETLADFTEELEQALVIYQTALAKAIAMDSKDFISSISLSIAILYVELDQTEAAIHSLKMAQDSAQTIVDKELKEEINTLLTTLLEANAV